MITIYTSQNIIDKNRKLKYCFLINSRGHGYNIQYRTISCVTHLVVG